MKAKIADKILQRFGYVKAGSRTQKRFYDAAKIDRLTTGWAVTNTSADVVIRQGLRNLRGRSRNLAENNDYAKRFLKLVSNNVVGSNGISLQLKIKDPGGNIDQKANATIENEFKIWAKASGWIDRQRIFAETMPRDGEIIIRHIKGKAAGNKYNYDFQMIEGDQLDEQTNDENKNIKMGIEYDTFGRPAFYWIWKFHPGDYPYTNFNKNALLRIPANEILHCYIKERPSQSRGVPWMHSAMTRLNNLGAYEEAEIIAARVGASKMGVIISKSGDEFQGVKDEHGNVMMDVEPGTFDELPQDHDFKMFDPTHPAGNFGPFMKATLRGVAAGINVSYNSLANDLESVNYSSLRAGSIDERDNWMTIQGWMIRAFCEPIFAAWLDMALLSGIVQLPYAKYDKFNAPYFQGRRWQWVDPLKDSEANILDIKNCLRTRTSVLAEQGMDFEDVVDRLSYEEKYIKEKGVTMDGAFTPKRALKSRRFRRKENKMPETKIKTGMLYREFAFNRETINKDDRTVELSFSSELPYERFFGLEILSHEQGAVRMDRLNNGAPFLLNHNTDEQIGVVEKAYISPDRKGRALVRFSRSQRAEEIFQDVLDDIRRNVSVGYLVHRMVLQEQKDEIDTYLVDDWEPLEVSSVPVPADNSVGVGRAGEFKDFNTIIQKRSNSMDPLKDQNANNSAVQIDINEVRKDERQKEQSRIREITAIADKHECVRELAREYIEAGKSADEFRKDAINKITEESNERLVVNMPLSEKQNAEYSVLRAIRFAAYGNNEDKNIEVEMHKEIEKKLGRQSKGIFIPMQLRAPLLTVTSGQGTGYSVATQLMDLITILRNKMLVKALGATVLSGLTSSVAFPRQSGAGSLYWTGENPGADVTETELTMDQVTLAPKSAQATTAYSRQLVQQSSLDVENLVRNDLAAINALGLDLAAINGSGASNQPRGILNVSGIGDVPGGTNGLAPTWAHITTLEQLVAVANADIGSLAYLSNAKVRGKLKNTQKVATYGNDFIWQDGNEPGFGMMNGYKAGVSGQVPSNLVKGTSGAVCSAIIFGNWIDLLIGEFGVLEIIVDPYAKKKQGLIEVTSLLMADIAVRHPESFAAMKDALTT